MATTAHLAKFTRRTIFEELDGDVVDRLKQQVLDTLGVALGARGARPPEIVLATLPEDEGLCRLWGEPTTARPADAALYNTTKLGFLHFTDSFLAPRETPHPAENIPAVLSAGEAVDAPGTDLITALGVAYEIQGALAWAAPVRDRGWDHVTHTNFSATCGIGSVMGLDVDVLRDALGIAGTAHNALRVTRTGDVTPWRDVACAHAARNALTAVLLAREGMGGPRDVLEGKHGWQQVVSGDFEVDFTPCERVRKTLTRKYAASTHAQSAIEVLLGLLEDRGLAADRLEEIRLETFRAAKRTLGGEDTNPYDVQTRAEAHGSLPYILAVAALDGTITPEQFEPDRISSPDVQDLLQRVTVHADPDLTERFNRGQLPARVTLTTKDGRTPDRETATVEGHPEEPVDWAFVESKFRSLTESVLAVQQQGEIVHTVKNLEEHSTRDLARHLSVPAPE